MENFSKAEYKLMLECCVVELQNIDKIRQQPNAKFRIKQLDERERTLKNLMKRIGGNLGSGRYDDDGDLIERS